MVSLAYKWRVLVVAIVTSLLLKKCWFITAALGRLQSSELSRCNCSDSIRGEAPQASGPRLQATGFRPEACSP